MSYDVRHYDTTGGVYLYILSTYTFASCTLVAAGSLRVQRCRLALVLSLPSSLFSPPSPPHSESTCRSSFHSFLIHRSGIRSASSDVCSPLTLGHFDPSGTINVLLNHTATTAVIGEL